jgi:hypothetical protein
MSRARRTSVLPMQRPPRATQGPESPTRTGFRMYFGECLVADVGAGDRGKGCICAQDPVDGQVEAGGRGDRARAPLAGSRRGLGGAVSHARCVLAWSRLFFRHAAPDAPHTIAGAPWGWDRGAFWRVGCGGGAEHCIVGERTWNSSGGSQWAPRARVGTSIIVVQLAALGGVPLGGAWGVTSAAEGEDQPCMTLGAVCVVELAIGSEHWVTCESQSSPSQHNTVPPSPTR